MAKSRMAVKQQSGRDFKTNIAIPEVKPFYLKASKFFLALVVVTLLGFYGNKFWQQLWPIEKIVLEGDYRYFHKDNLTSLINQESAQGLLAINLKKLKKNIENSDWVQSIEIRKVWPDQLIFNLVEHEPVIFVGDGVLTREGGLIKTLLKDEYIERLPEFDFLDNKNLSEERTIAVWNEFKQIKKLLFELKLNVKKLTISELDSWKIDFKSGLQISLGRKNRFKRVQRLVKTYPLIKDKTAIKRIDLRYHNGLAIRWLDNQSEIASLNNYLKRS